MIMSPAVFGSHMDNELVMRRLVKLVDAAGLMLMCATPCSQCSGG